MSELKPITDTRAILGEGAIWYEDRLYWVDIEGKRIYRYDPQSDSEESIQLQSKVGTVVPRAKGGLVVALETGFAFVDEQSGQTTPIADPEKGVETRFNDGKCDPAGRFWAGTMALSGGKPIGGLYALETDGSVSKKLDSVAVSNGICWSLDQTTMYYIDSVTRHVAAFDYDVTDGTITNRRVVVEFAEAEGIPDGMTIDERGYLWIALWDGNAVVCHDPNTGRRHTTIDLPASLITSCAFGGNNLDELYITSARTGLSEQELERQPDAGGLFRTRVGVKGVPSFAYRG